MDGFIASQQGIDRLLDKGYINIDEYRDLMAKNLTRLQDKVSEWRVTEKMMCITFALLFGWFSVTTSQEEIVRTMNRTGRRTRKEQQLSE